MKICIDAGHYGKYNPSTVVAGYYESEFTWKYHLLLKAELEKYGVTVITTRTNQKSDLGLQARGKKSAGCDLFLSLHSNACSVENVDYPLACCCVSGKADSLGQKLADTVARVMETRQNGRIIKKVGNGNADWYGVLRGAAMVGVPGILLEHSFHTNTRATKWLMDDTHLAEMAKAEAKTIAEHYGLTAKSEPVSNPVENTTPTTPSNVTTTGYRVRVVCNALNVRSGPGTSNKVNTIIKKNEIYTILSEQNGWGKLKSGAGWINLSSAYVKKV